MAKQAETATIATGTTLAGNAKAVITSAYMPNSPKTIVVIVGAGITADAAAALFRATLALDGARQENERFWTRSNAMEAMTGTYVFSRHEFARDQNAIGVRREEAKKQLIEAAGECQKLIDRIEPKVFDSERRAQFKRLLEAIDVYVKLAVCVGMYTGAINEDQLFMDLVDEAMKNGKTS